MLGKSIHRNFKSSGSLSERFFLPSKTNTPSKKESVSFFKHKVVVTVKFTLIYIHVYMLFNSIMYFLMPLIMQYTKNSLFMMLIHSSDADHYCTKQVDAFWKYNEAERHIEFAPTRTYCTQMHTSIHFIHVVSCQIWT